MPKEAHVYPKSLDALTSLIERSVAKQNELQEYIDGAREKYRQMRVERFMTSIDSSNITLGELEWVLNEIRNGNIELNREEIARAAEERKPEPPKKRGKRADKTEDKEQEELKQDET